MERVDAYGLKQNNPFTPDTVKESFVGKMESRFVDIYEDNSCSSADLMVHSHDFCEIQYYCNDCGAEFLLGSERFRLRKGDIIMIPAGVSHCLLQPEPMTGPCKRYGLRFSNEFGQYMTRLCPEPSPADYNHPALLHTAGTQWEYIGDMFRSGVQTAEIREPNWESVLFGSTVQILIHLYYCLRDSTKPKSKSKDLVEQIQSYVELHLAERITREDAAKHFFISENTLSHIFRKKMGVSFHRYVALQRLNAAKMLIDEDIQLKLVAKMVGFADYSSFYRVFKQEYGISPEQYRKQKEKTDPSV